MVSRLTEEPAFFPSQVFLNDLRARIPKQQFETWFQGNLFEFIPPNKIVISSPTRFHSQWLETKFKDPIRHSFLATFKLEPDMDFRLASAGGAPPEDPPAGAVPAGSALEPLASSAVKKDHRFENFAVGASNRFTYTAVYAVVENLHQNFNPIVVFGSTGLGKTHLLQACYLKLQENRQRPCLYKTAGDFISDLYKFSGTYKREMIHKLFRRQEVLIIDDLQILSRSQHFQEEFLRIFNEFISCGHQLVLSCNCHPKELTGLKDKLISRLKMGLVTGLFAPTAETRLDLIYKKSRLLGLQIPDAAAHALARELNLNPREIEGRLLQLSSPVSVIASQMGTASQMGSAPQLIGGGGATELHAGGPFPPPRPGGSRHFAITDILKAVSAYYNIKRADLLSESRQQSLVQARQVGMFLARFRTALSLKEIGSFFGGRDHATVIHAVRKITTLVKKDPKVAEDLNVLTRQLESRS